MIHSFVFTDGKLAARDLDPDALKLVRSDKGLFIWVDLDQPTEEETRTILEDLFHFHPLAIEDCVSVSQRPKMEDYDEYFFMTMHAVDFSRTDKFSTTELDLFLGKDFLVTYHTKELQSMRAARDRCINKNTGLIARAPDRLLHTILDMLVDKYTPVLNELTEETDEIEERLLEHESPELIPEMLAVRKELGQLRRILRPQQEVINRLARGESKLIRASMLPYFRDLHDHLVRTEELAGSHADQLLLSFDVYMNKIANQTNESIKVLTALTALTIPPMLVGSWYGMNFEGMPELHSMHGYVLVSIGTVVAMLVVGAWLKWKKWFRGLDQLTFERE